MDNNKRHNLVQTIFCKKKISHIFLLVFFLFSVGSNNIGYSQSKFSTQRSLILKKYKILGIHEAYYTPLYTDFWIKAQDIGIDHANKSIWYGKIKSQGTWAHDDNTLVGRIFVGQLEVGKAYDIYITDRTKQGDVIVSDKVPQKFLMHLGNPSGPVKALKEATFVCFHYGQRNPEDIFKFANIRCRIVEWTDDHIKVMIPKLSPNRYYYFIERNGVQISKLNMSTLLQK